MSPTTASATKRKLSMATRSTPAKIPKKASIKKTPKQPGNTKKKNTAATKKKPSKSTKKSATEGNVADNINKETKQLTKKSDKKEKKQIISTKNRKILMKRKRVQVNIMLKYVMLPAKKLGRQRLKVV